LFPAEDITQLSVTVPHVNVIFGVASSYSIIVSRLNRLQATRESAFTRRINCCFRWSNFAPTWI